MVRRFMALAGVVLIAVLAFCLLDGGHAADGDLCSGLAVLSVGLAMASLVTLTGRILPVVTETYRLCPSDLLAPPPRG